MSFALTQQGTWACSVCGEESLWEHQAHEILHQQTKRRYRFVCERCIDRVVEAMRVHDGLGDRTGMSLVGHSRPG
jgi:hypothetical protein